MCKFFVVWGSGQALLGMPDTDMLNIIKINCNTIGTHRNDINYNCSTNTAIHHSSKHVQHYTNTSQDVDRAEESCANMDPVSKFENKDKPVVIDKELNTISYSLPGPDWDNERRVSLVITQELQK